MTTRKPKKKPATTGERIVFANCPNMSVYYAREHFRNNIERKQKIRKIDTAIRRAVRDAYDTGKSIARAECKSCRREFDVVSAKTRIERKYRVKL